jgi:hypothetical protein
VLRSIGASAGDPMLVVEASEHLLDQQVVPAGAPTAAALWQEYDTAAAMVANREQLLTGDDAGWSDAAGRLAARDPAGARVLFARLALQARNADARANARLQLASALRDSRLTLTAARLFEDRSRFDPATLGADLRRLLGELAAARGQHALAADYWQGLGPRPGQAADDWQLDQAQVLLRSGRVELAGKALGAMLPAGRSAPTPAACERARARAALSIVQSLRSVLEGAPAASVAPGLRRSLLLSGARAHEASDAPLQAAQQYLAAAVMPEFRPGDPAQIEARWNAARNLARAGMRDEARAQLDWLARNTRDPGLLEQVKRERARLP